MLKVIEENQELILRDFPVVHLVTGIALIFMGLVIGTSAFDFTVRALSAGNYDWAVFVPVVLSPLFVIFGIYFIAKAPVITTTISRQRKSLTVEKRSLLKKEFDEYEFDQIEKNLLVETVTHKGTSYHTPQIQLKTGEKIGLISHGLMRRGKAYDIVDLAGKYLADESDKDNFRLTILNDD